MTTLTTVNSLDFDANGAGGSYSSGASGTTSEVNLFSQTIPGGTFNDGAPPTDVAKRNYKLEAWGTWFNNAGSTKTTTIRVYVNKPGETQFKILDTGAMSISSSTLNKNLKLDVAVFVKANGGPDQIGGALALASAYHGSMTVAETIEHSDFSGVMVADPGVWSTANDLVITVTAQSSHANVSMLFAPPFELVG